MPPSEFISATVTASSIEMQSHSTLPCAVRSSKARCPMAKRGCVAMPRMSGVYSCHALKCVSASFSCVVQFCPDGPTYCRASSQIGQFFGALSAGGYCAPQVTQIKAGIGFLPFRSCRLSTQRARHRYSETVHIGLVIVHVG